MYTFADHLFDRHRSLSCTRHLQGSDDLRFIFEELEIDRHAQACIIAACMRIFVAAPSSPMIGSHNTTQHTTQNRALRTTISVARARRSSHRGLFSQCDVCWHVACDRCIYCQIHGNHDWWYFPCYREADAADLVRVTPRRFLVGSKLDELIEEDPQLENLTEIAAKEAGEKEFIIPEVTTAGGFNVRKRGPRSRPLHRRSGKSCAQNILCS